MSAEKIERALRSAGEDLAQADEARKAALAKITKAMREGDGSIPVQRMAEWAGVSRVTAYRLLDRD